MILSRLKNQKQVLSKCKYCATDKVVSQGLAITPADVEELTNKGIPVSISNAPWEGQDLEKGDFNIDPMFRRDVDRNTLWETSQEAKGRILKARNVLSKKEKNKK